MTEESRFFRNLWRLNGILFAFVVIAMALGVLALGFSLVFDVFRNSYDFVPQKKQAPERYKYVLNAGASMPESADEVFLPLLRASKDYERGSSYGGGPAWQVNLLALDIRSGKGRWLFQGTEQQLESLLGVRARFESSGLQDQNPLKALLLTVTDADTDGDGVFGKADRKTVYLYRPGDARAAKMMTVDEIISLKQVDAENLLLVARDGTATKSMFLSTGDFTVRTQSILPAYGQ